MERGCMTFTAASSAPPRPAAAFRLGWGQSPYEAHRQFRLRGAHCRVISQNGGDVRSKRSLSVKALQQSLSSNWDVSSYAAPSWLPRFEELDTTNMLLRQRIIFLGTQIDDMTADFVISQLLLLDSEDNKKDIRLFINSPGGSVTAGMGIYDAMKLCKADVSTTCMGLAASMGAFLLACGTKGKRYCMPNARVMIHQPLGTAGGKATDMSIRIREMAYHKVKLNKILSRVTGKPEHQVELDTDRDNFMSAWEAKEYGLVDAVIDDGKPGLVAPSVDDSPPPKTRVWDLWRVEGSRKARKNLPSEEAYLQNGHVTPGDDEDKETEQIEEAASPP
ncbi:ATP-dependent Clp protease proteolytic subunit 3, chloroplastic [Andrographis paniculata]|uniref:ATP-dependent Clp protease proteolytic subunit 3, chloroplastic n=1 Tax=Andrographis paniculata TaxID=175694 RepID=UPI0021E916E2|nr:ATP-dependent Clp protease proteolytic subunit 3, chloroplastic [Andrographis paniculata]